MTLLWICFVVFLLYYAALVATNLIFYPKIVEAINAGIMKRTSLYWQMMAGLWAPALAILLLAAFGVFSFANIGVLPRSFPCPMWLRITAYVLAGLYFLFLLTQNVVLFRSMRKGENNTQDIPDKLRALLPANTHERRIWAGAAITAGVCEELMFRGFLLYVLLILFPGLGLPLALGIATLLFGAGHLYQGPKEALKPLVVGLLLGLIYIAFGTLLPCVLLHAMQDLAAGWAAGGPVSDNSVQQ